MERTTNGELPGRIAARPPALAGGVGAVSMARGLAITPALPSLGALATTLKQYAAELPADELPALVGELEAAKALAWARLTTLAPNPTPDSGTLDLLDAKAMAGRLRVPESWLREHARRGRIPCVYVGRYMRFDPERVRRALDEQPTGVVSGTATEQA